VIRRKLRNKTQNFRVLCAPDISHFQLGACELICGDSRCSYHVEMLRTATDWPRARSWCTPAHKPHFICRLQNFGWLPPPHLNAVRSRRLQQDAVQLFDWAKDTHSQLFGTILSSGTLLVAHTVARSKPTMTQYVKLRPSRRIYIGLHIHICLWICLRKPHYTKFLSLCRPHVHYRRAPGGCQPN